MRRGPGRWKRPEPRAEDSHDLTGPGPVVPPPDARRAEPSGAVVVESIRAVRPLRGLAPWIGGKRNLALHLAAIIEGIPHTCYAEPFVGMGGVFFRRRRRAPHEVVNDLAGDVVNLFRIVRHHPAALLTEMRFGLHARAELARLVAIDPATLTDVQRAARFLGIQRMGYGGKPDSTSFPATPDRGKAMLRVHLRRRIRDAHARLEGVTIEQLPYDRFIEAYDSEATLFYLDPPYWGSESDYGRGMFSRTDFAKLARILASLKGRFVLSINDVPATREIFSAFAAAEVAHHYRASGRVTPARELVITDGRPLPARAQAELF